MISFLFEDRFRYLVKYWLIIIIIVLTYSLFFDIRVSTSKQIRWDFLTFPRNSIELHKVCTRHIHMLTFIHIHLDESRLKLILFSLSLCLSLLDSYVYRHRPSCIPSLSKRSAYEEEQELPRVSSLLWLFTVSLDVLKINQTWLKFSILLFKSK